MDLPKLERYEPDNLSIAWDKLTNARRLSYSLNRQFMAQAIRELAEAIYLLTGLDKSEWPDVEPPTIKEP